MNLRALMFLGFVGFIAQPALAQTAPATATGPTTASATMDSLLASGYEVKAVNPLSDAAIKEVFTSQVPSQVLITLQKGTSVAVCEMATVSWLNVQDQEMTDAARCNKR